MEDLPFYLNVCPSKASEYISRSVFISFEIKLYLIQFNLI